MEEVNERKWCVYMHVNKHNYKTYVGITGQKPKERWGRNGIEYLRKDNNNEYYHKVFAMALKKYPDWENDWDHIIFAENLSQEEASHMEMLLIGLYKTNCNKYKNPSYGYNMTDGGEGSAGRYHTEESVKKISDAIKERWKDEEYRYFQVNRLTGEGNPMFGKTHTEEVKEKLRVASTGKTPSEATREKLSKKMIERWANPDYKTKMIERKKDIVYSQEARNNISNAKGGQPVIQYSMFGEYIKEYKYINDASNITGINSGSIYNACCKKRHSAGGYRWRFSNNPLTEEELKEFEEWWKNR